MAWHHGHHGPTSAGTGLTNPAAGAIGTIADGIRQGLRTGLAVSISRSAASRSAALLVPQCFGHELGHVVPKAPDLRVEGVQAGGHLSEQLRSAARWSW